MGEQSPKNWNLNEVGEENLQSKVPGKENVGIKLPIDQKSVDFHNVNRVKKNEPNNIEKGQN